MDSTYSDNLIDSESDRAENKTMRQENMNFLDQLAQGFSSYKFIVNRNVQLNCVVADLFCKKRGNYFGVIPFIDYYFIFIVGGNLKNNTETLLFLNDSSLAYVNKLHRLPRWLRWTVPNTATVCVSFEEFPTALIDYVRETRVSQVGNSNSLLLVDVPRGRTISLSFSGLQGLVPNKRAANTVSTVCRSIFLK